MKCPKCGFISFPGYEQCKKCGHQFTQVNGPAEGIPPLFHHPAPEKKAPHASEPETSLDQTELTEPESGELDVELEPQVPASEPVKPEPEPPLSQDAPPRPGLSPWQSELADRVQEYRQRRARLTSEMEKKLKALDLDFGIPASKPEEGRPHVIEFPVGEGPASRPRPKPEFRSAPPSFGMSSFESAFREAQEENPNPPPPPPPDPPSQVEMEPLEIELGPSEDSPTVVREDEASTVPIAHMNMRFYAGLIDALVLLAGAGLYALIFWQVGGRFSFRPLQLAATGLVAAFFIILYFSGCTALASATPGLMWAGLEVITFEGNQPRISDCLWRGFGYLVSMSALMLGFIWAAVDAEGLTWHDRMSRTFVVPAEDK